MRGRRRPSWLFMQEEELNTVDLRMRIDHAEARIVAGHDLIRPIDERVKAPIGVKRFR